MVPYLMERNFKNYRQRFASMLSSCHNVEDFVDTFLPLYESSMDEFEQIQGKLHWSVLIAMKEGRLLELQPALPDDDKKSCIRDFLNRLLQ